MVAPLRSAFDASEEPGTFVRWWAEKYDLEMLTSIPIVSGSGST